MGEKMFIAKWLRKLQIMSIRLKGGKKEREEKESFDSLYSI